MQLLKDIERIEKTTYPITCNNTTRNIKFYISELPNDMKMICFLSGELSNSATYFSSFADVTKDNMKSLSGTFGREAMNTWKPWKYTHRLKVADAVEKLKTKISKQKIADSTKRSKITNFISQQHSRQEFKPEGTTR